MFIALPSHSFALQRSAMCFSGFSLHAAPDGAGYVRNLGAINMLLLRSKSFGTNWSKSFGTNARLYLGARALVPIGARASVPIKTTFRAKLVEELKTNHHPKVGCIA